MNVLEQEREIAARRAGHEQHRAELGGQLNSAQATIARLRQAEAHELDQAGREHRAPKVTTIRGDLAEAVQAEQDIRAQIVGAKREADGCDGELLRLHADERQQYIDLARKSSATAAAQLATAVAQDAVAAYRLAQSAWRGAWAGHEPTDEDPELRARVGNFDATARIPGGAVKDLVKIATAPIHLGVMDERWDPVALLAEVAGHLNGRDCLPSGLLVDDLGQGLPGFYTDACAADKIMDGGHALFADHLRTNADIARDSKIDAHGFVRLRRVRDLTAEEVEHQRRVDLGKPHTMTIGG